MKHALSLIMMILLFISDVRADSSLMISVGEKVYDSSGEPAQVIRFNNDGSALLRYHGKNTQRFPLSTLCTTRHQKNKKFKVGEKTYDDEARLGTIKCIFSKSNKVVIKRAYLGYSVVSSSSLAKCSGSNGDLRVGQRVMSAKGPVNIACFYKNDRVLVNYWGIGTCRDSCYSAYYYPELKQKIFRQGELGIFGQQADLYSNKSKSK